MYHLMDQAGCGENDPNGPVFDPVHGVFHLFYQIHLAASPGHGPDYGHFVTKDLIHWAALPVAIWNGLDASVWPPRITSYDNEAIYTGSAVVLDGAGPGGKGRGVIQIYPGLCNKNDWAGCRTGTLLAQAVPADYANDALLVNWTKPTYNPIVENTQRDPSTPWKTPAGEWRLRTYDSMVYGAASDADVVSGKWYTIGKSKSFRTCECPSFYPLPPPTPGTASETAYAIAATNGSLPTHVHKTSCGGDWWQIGTYSPGEVNTTGSFTPTVGWEDSFRQRRIDVGRFYASKDALYPTKGSDALRRVNWGWAQVPPQSTQTLPREITFNAAARVLEQAPLEELKALRGKPAFLTKAPLRLPPGADYVLPVSGAIVAQSELVVVFQLPPAGEATFSVSVGVLSARRLRKEEDAMADAVEDEVGNEAMAPSLGADPQAIDCSVSYSSPTNTSASYYDVPVRCGKASDVLRILTSERTLSLRVFSDATFMEAYFQDGRVAITETLPVRAHESTAVAIGSNTASVVQSVALYPMRSIWTTPDAVRKAPRVYNGLTLESHVESTVIG